MCCLQLAKELADAKIELTHCQGNLRIEKEFTTKLKRECEQLLADIQTVTDEKNAIVRQRGGDSDELRAMRASLDEKQTLFDMARTQNEKLVGLINELNDKALAAKEAHLSKEKQLETELHDLYAQVKHRDARLAIVERELGIAKADVTTLGAEASKVPFLVQKLAKTQENVQALSVRLAEAEAEATRAKRQLESVTRERDQAKKQLAASERDADRAKRDAAAAEGKLVAARDAEHADHATRQRLLDEAAALRAHYEDSIAMYVLEIEKLHQDLPVLSAEKAILAAKLAEYEADLAKEIDTRLGAQRELLETRKQLLSVTTTNDELSASARRAAGEVGSFQLQLAEAKSTIGNLTMTVARLEHEAEELTASLRAEEAHNKDMRLQKDQALARLQTMFQEHAAGLDARGALEQQVHALRRELALKSADDSVRTEQVQVLQVSIDESESVMKQMHELKAGLERDVDSLSAQLAVADAERKAHEATAHKLREELAGVQRELEARAQAVGAKTESVELLERHLAEEKTARERCADKLTACQADVKQLLSEKATLLSQKIALEELLATCQRQVRAGTSSADATEQAQAASALASSRLSDRIAFLENELSERDYEIASLKSELRALEADNDAANLTNKSIEQELELSKTSVSLDKVERSKDELKADWEREKGLMQSRIEEGERLASRLKADLDAEHAALETFVQATKAKAEDERKEMTNAKRQVREAIMESEAVRAELSHAQVRLEAERTRLANEAELRDKLEEQLTALQADLETARATIADLTRTNGDLVFLRNVNAELQARCEATEKELGLLRGLGSSK